MADYQKKLDKFSRIETQVVALSVDSEEDAQKTVKRNGLKFPVLYALDAREMVTTMGAYIHEEKFYLHATGFVLRPDKTIELAGYSSGTISRITTDDALTLSKYLRRSS